MKLHELEALVIQEERKAAPPQMPPVEPPGRAGMHRIFVMDPITNALTMRWIKRDGNLYRQHDSHLGAIES